MSALSLGFIGGADDSRLGPMHHAAATLDGRWTLSAGAFSRDTTRSKRSAARWGVRTGRCYSDWEDMLSTEYERLDAVAILTPTEHRCAIAQYALSVNVSPICPAPIALNIRDTHNLSTLSKQPNNHTTYLHHLCGYSMVRELRHRINRGVLGTLWHYEVTLPLGYLSADSAQNSSTDLDFNATDPDILCTLLSELGAQALGLIDFLIEESAEAVFCDLSHHGPSRADLPTNAVLLLRYPSGLRGRIWLSSTATGSQDGCSIRLNGARGEAKWREANPEQLQINGIDGSQHRLAPGAPRLSPWTEHHRRLSAPLREGSLDALANLYADIADGILGYRQGRAAHPMLAPLSQAVDALTLLQAAQRSAHEQAWIEL